MCSHNSDDCYDLKVLISQHRKKIKNITPLNKYVVLLITGRMN